MPPPAGIGRPSGPKCSCRSLNIPSARELLKRGGLVVHFDAQCPLARPAKHSGSPQRFRRRSRGCPSPGRGSAAPWWRRPLFLEGLGHDLGPPRHHVANVGEADFAQLVDDPGHGHPAAVFEPRTAADAGLSV
jgi:hypothetical protein